MTKKIYEDKFLKFIQLKIYDRTQTKYESQAFNF